MYKYVYRRHIFCDSSYPSITRLMHPIGTIVVFAIWYRINQTFANVIDLDTDMHIICFINYKK